jgi:photosystem II stability/assembly factor-like uncharacterized protein
MKALFIASVAVVSILSPLSSAFSLQSAEGSGVAGGARSSSVVSGVSGGTGFGSLAVGGGGWVTGLSFSDDGRTRLVRTDTFGAYVWGGGAWRLDVSASSLPAGDVHPGLGGGVLAVAVAPSDASVAYMAFDNGVYRSSDGAKTWSRVLSGVSTEPNDNFRMWGSRLVVDPRDPNVVYYGSQLGGLYVTRDGGGSWSRVPVASVPAGLVVDITDAATRGSVSKPTNTSQPNPTLASAGVSAIAVDRSGGTVGGRSATIYAASYGKGIFRSQDGGSTWTLISPAAIGAVEYLRVLSNGDVLATSHVNPTDIFGVTDVWRFHGGSWVKSGPAGARNWQSIAVDPNSAGHVALMAWGGYLALSTDYGATWTQVPRTVQSGTGDVPWIAWALNGGTNYMSPGELAFDPVVPGRLWFTEGEGVWYADVTSPTVHWISQSRGIEQLVPTDVIDPPGGKPLLTAWDRPIFRSEDPRTYPATYGPSNGFSGGWSIDWSLTDPNYVVASVAAPIWPSDPKMSGYSQDGGKTWTPFPTLPEHSTNAVTTFGFGSIAVSTPGNIVWVPSYGKRPEYTKDGGKSWKPITLPGITDYSVIDKSPNYVSRRVITADRVNPGTFYLFVLDHGIYRTTDGGDTWTQQSDYTAFSADHWWYWNVSMKAVPGHAGELYLTPGQLTGLTTIPLKRSLDGGATWTNIPNVTGVTAFGFGKPFPGSTHPAIYLAGYVNNKYGIWRSTDDATTWTYLTTYPDDKTATVTSIDGDKNTPGTVYLSLAGAGWTYGTLRSEVGKR